jgi:hypothetical protein
MAVRCSCGVALEGRLGLAYNEEAFRHFLAIERKRGDRSCHSTLLLLISMKRQPAMSRRMPPRVAAGVFSGLWDAVREADVIGWFREDRVAGALLTQGADPPVQGVPLRIARRITEMLSVRVPRDAARQLHVRVVQLQPSQRS